MLIATVAGLLIALSGLIAWQTSSGLSHVDRMMRERSLALHDAAAREVRNVARYGVARRERLDEVLRAIATGGDAAGALLERSQGALRMTHGELPPGGEVVSLTSGLRLVGDTILVAGPVQIQTSGCHTPTTADEAGSCESCPPSCPAAGDSAIDGDYRLVVALTARPHLELRRSVRFQGLAGGALLGALAVALWLFARQTRRASDMRAALSRADERARYLGRLTLVAGGLAHEIKNPLGSLRGFAQLIGESVAPGSKEAEYASLMVSELDAINRRIDGLRHFARPSCPELRPCRPAEVVRRVTALLAPDAIACDVRLELQLAAGADAETLGDEDRLRDLVVNLVVNAIEASPAGGVVAVDLSMVVTDRSPAVATPVTEYLLQVTDQGPGIAPAARDAALRPFHSTKPEGLGLGLALAQRAVEDHGGRLEIDDARGGGALLRARWPLRDP